VVSPPLSESIYVMGGWDGNLVMSSMEKYSPGPGSGWEASNSWEVLPPMRERRMNFVAGVLQDGNIIVAGGARPDDATGEVHNLASVELFDTATGLWREAPPMFLARSNAAAAVVDGKFIVCGGGAEGARPGQVPSAYQVLGLHSGEFQGTSGGAVSSCEEYDPATRQWRDIAPMRSPRAGALGMEFDGQLLVVGGFYGESTEALHVGRVGSISHYITVERYDPETGQWYPMPDMLTARGNHFGGVLDGTPHVFGGVCNGRLTTGEMLVPV